MRVKTFSRLLRILSTIVLFFFIWTFGPIWQAVAFAATNGRPGVKSAASKAQQQEKQQPEERLEKVLEDIRGNVTKTESKVAKGEDASSEIQALKAKKAEIETLDAELKGQFSATEKKLKDAKLPKEILNRHYAFIKHYENNVSTLKAEIDDIEKAKSKSDRTAKIQKVREHLEKVKPPKKIILLDPNKLPHRTVKAKERAPRLKKEEFKKDFPTQKKAKKLASIKNTFSANTHELSRIKHKPIQLAFNDSGTFSDQPFSFRSDRLSASSSTSINDFIPQLALSDSTPILLAQATDLPTPDDLASTPEIQLDSPLIRVKAAELGCNIPKLYAFTRNEIKFVPTWGSIQGAEQCLLTKECNSFDTNAVLASLLRVCSVPVRLNFGTIELPIEKVMNWAGGFSDPVSALNYIASGGIPITGLRSGGKIYAARLETVWLRVFVDYIPSMGAVHKEGDTFIPLDASYKQYTHTDGVDLHAAVPFDGQGLANQIKATATVNEQESYVTNVDSALIQTALNDYNAQLDNYVTQNLPDATPGDILGKKEIIKKEQPILPASLPYKVVVAGAETTEVPDSLRHKVTIQLVDADSLGTVFTYTISLPQLAGKRFTVSYDPVTTADQDTINRYTADYATSIPAYLIQFRPILKIENTTVATGAPVGMGSAQDLNIALISPRGTEIVTHNLLAGDYTAIGLNPSKINLDAFQNRVNKNDFSEPVGEMLHQTALSYWAETDAFNNVIAKTLRVNSLRHPSELAASAKVSVSYIWGVPSSATYNRRNFDVKFDNQTVFSKNADRTKEFNYMQQSGVNSSFLEGAIFDQLFGGNIGDGISAITALKAANDQGIPIYKIGSSNITTTLPKLQVADAIKTEISNAVNAGLTVQIPQTNITKSSWTGVGYIVSNPTDGSGAYRISGGLNGGDSGTVANTVIPLPQVPVTGPLAFVIDGIASNSGAAIQMSAGSTVLKSIAIPIGVGVALIDLTILILIAILIFLIVQTLVEKYPPQYRPFRHYTSFTSLKLVQTSMRLLPSTAGDLGPGGVYVTDTVILDPQVPGNAAIIAQKLIMPDVGKIQTYVDIAVNIGKVIIVNGQYRGFPDQYILYMPMPLWGYIPLDNDTAKVVTWGPFDPQQ